jgi:hypothetical protein
MAEVLLGLMVLVGLTMAGLAGLVWAASGSGIGLAVLLLGLALAAWSLLAFWRRDSVAAAKLMLFCCVMPGLVAVLWATNTTGGRGKAAGVAVACAAGAAACAVFLWREANRVEILPNVLLELAPAARIVEIDGGVQVLAGIGPRKDGGGAALHVHLQSCVSVPRTVRIALSGPLASPVLERPDDSALLGPGEVGVLVIPLQMARASDRPTPLFVAPAATEGPARRLRHWRARAYERHIGPGVQALLFLTGQLAWGGGVPRRDPGLDGPRGRIEARAARPLRGHLAAGSEPVAGPHTA